MTFTLKKPPGKYDLSRPETVEMKSFIDFFFASETVSNRRNGDVGVGAIGRLHVASAQAQRNHAIALGAA